MYQTVTNYDFHDAFRDAGREDFSYEALDELFEYYEQLEQEIGEQIELDPVAICCEWSEYESWEAAQEDLDIINEDSPATFHVLHVGDTGRVLVSVS